MTRNDLHPVTCKVTPTRISRSPFNPVNAAHDFAAPCADEVRQRINEGRVLDFYWCLGFIQKRGREMYRSNFSLYEEDYDVIYKLLIYFLNHELEAQRLGIDLHKGLHITGPIGCGKTSLLNVMRYVPKPDRFYNMKPCRDISFEFIQDGYEVIDRYTRMSYTNMRPKVYCFDDLGSENNIRYYGNNCNVLGEILTSRYDLFMSSNMITHITTNLSASELESLYGNRLRSRQREMFNLVAFSANSKDKRQ